MAEFLDPLSFDVPDPGEEVVVLTEKLRYRALRLDFVLGYSPGIQKM